ncbi:MAG: recombinase zinc beta ribbon domain-containing protein [Oscillospiraceae bacterium]|nr:recombinase zinc beta ribbon domain-containing protein [Oscillospiraceae bacterium]
MVQTILAKKSYMPKQGQKHLLTGLMFCGNCGAPITFMPQHKKGKFYTCCSTAKRYKKELGLCKMQLIPEELIEDYIFHHLKKLSKEYVDKEKLTKNANKIEFKKVIDKVLEFEEIDRNTLALLIEKIIINLDKSIEIHFNFRSSMV